MKVAVTSKAFGRNEILKSELLSFFPDSSFNTTGRLLTAGELVDFLEDCDAAIIAMEEICPPVLDNLTRLKAISKFGVGLDNIDLEYCKLRNIPVMWTEGVNSFSVAEMTLGFMLMLVRNLYTTSNQLKQGVWNKSGGRSLYEKTVGIIGLGHIGREVARLLKPFNCRILVNDIVDMSVFCTAQGLTQVSKERVYAESDIITVHTPLNDSTNKLMNQKTIGQMKQRPILINTARGNIFDLEDLKVALLNGTITGAAIDVYDTEPPDDAMLLSIDNLICTPHIGGNSVEATMAMGRSAIRHLVNNLCDIPMEKSNVS